MKRLTKVVRKWLIMKSIFQKIYTLFSQTVLTYGAVLRFVHVVLRQKNICDEYFENFALRQILSTSKCFVNKSPCEREFFRGFFFVGSWNVILFQEINLLTFIWLYLQIVEKGKREVSLWVKKIKRKLRSCQKSMVNRWTLRILLV